MLLREASTLLGKRSDKEDEDEEEEDLEPKIVSVPAFSSKYLIAKEVDGVLSGKGTKKRVLLIAVYLIGDHILLLDNICTAQRSGDLQIRLKD
ncbi:hypothetical protein QR680_010887 [Steinernema hermaphroditum]|uniref:Uncharacterized protein n=1 Tax=Steinernema hermaphroditum TaxID=289476 RepID=A0AA39MCF3_9BILA|nr:hypothetical protein QR680_010887 [Steinernema hermaphroditum]